MTSEEIELLKNYQNSPKFHPFTCCSYNGCERSENNNWGVLIPTETKWVCPCGKYRQEYTGGESSMMEIAKPRKIYLAIPYSNHEEMSFELVNKIAGQLIEDGNIVFSPISMSHPIAKANDMSGKWNVWKKIDFEFIKWCDEMIVVNFDSEAVRKSVGVSEEMAFAKELHKPIIFYYGNEKRS